MRCFIGLGSNQGKCCDNLEAAAQALSALPGVSGLRCSPVFITPALLPPNAPPAWNIPYHNAALVLDWPGTTRELLTALKQIERKIGRTSAPVWSPRPIDLDILLCEDTAIAEPDLQVPHVGLRQRSFVLDPLLHLAPGLQLPDSTPILAAARSLPSHAPVWMGILNLTPDSFSDGGALDTTEQLQQRLDAYDAVGVQILDLGAESTRPGALPLTAEQEWQRLEPVLRRLRQRYAGRHFSPLISVDTYRAVTAEKALNHGAHIINDVSGLADAAMLAVLRRHPTAEYILMHSVSVPADKTQTLGEDIDPVAHLLAWAKAKLAELDQQGIAAARVIFDPGIGFGKTAQQSLTLVQNISTLCAALPCRVLVGASRKSFIGLWSQQPAAARDDDSIGLSLRLAGSGVDMLRVHAAERHMQAWQAFQHAAPAN